MSAGTKPRSTFTPISSSPRPAPFGRMPTATSTTSVTIGVVLAAAHVDLDGERAVGVLLVAHRLGVLEDLGAVLHELLLDDRGALRIDAGEQRGRRLDDGELRAELLVDHAELEPDDAAADDEQALRHRRAG